jgi:hypothetical protein
VHGGGHLPEVADRWLDGSHLDPQQGSARRRDGQPGRQRIAVDGALERHRAGADAFERRLEQHERLVLGGGAGGEPRLVSEQADDEEQRDADDGDGDERLDQHRAGGRARRPRSWLHRPSVR